MRLYILSSHKNHSGLGSSRHTFLSLIHLSPNVLTPRDFEKVSFLGYCYIGIQVFVAEHELPSIEMSISYSKLRVRHNHFFKGFKIF